MQKLEPKKIKWDVNKISSLWAYYAKTPEHKWSYFSTQKGDSLIKYLNKKIKFSGTIIDIGCATGFLIEKLIFLNSVKIGGADFSKESIDLVNQKLKSKKNFLGAIQINDLTKLPYDNEHADLVFFLETLEHLFIDQVDKITGELNRIIKKNGYIILTTPNNEILESQNVFCANCKVNFHRYQHMQSFKTADVIEIMEKAKFKTISCEALRLKTKIYIALRYLICRLIKKNNLSYCPNCNETLTEKSEKRTSIISRLFKSYLNYRTIIYIGIKR